MNNLDQKKQEWCGKIIQQMQWDGESTDDEFAVFSKENYEIWKTRKKISMKS